ncbi:MAG: PAS domain S-box protein, partial [Chlorobiaceae bacterium]|nr:PAS domain S-box protein [Chlorobiaceae bacterium]
MKFSKTMNKNRVYEQDGIMLHGRAEERVKLPRQKQTKPSPLHDEMRRIMYEMEARHLELEMQNEQMLHSKGELESLLKRYEEHYDIVPHSYMTISRDGTILEVNLTAAKYFGRDRALLKGGSLERFVADEDRPVLRSFLERVFSGQKQAFCEVVLFNDEILKAEESPETDLHKDDFKEPVVRFDAALSTDGEECYIYITIS